MAQVNAGRVVIQDEGIHDIAATYKHPSIVKTAGGKVYLTKKAVAPGVALSDVTHWNLIIDSAGNAFDYKDVTDPSITVNPVDTGATWINKTSGEIFVCTSNVVDSNVWIGTSDNFVQVDTLKADIFYENGQSLTEDYILISSKNAITAGPVTIEAGVTVTIEDGATWTIV